MERNISDSAFVALLFGATLLCYLLIRKVSYGRFQAILTSFYSNREFKQHLKEEYFIKNYTTFFLGLVSMFSLSISLSLSISEVFIEKSFFVCSIIFAVVAIKVFGSYGLTKTISPFSTVIKSVYTMEILSLIVLGLAALLFIPIELFYSVNALGLWVYIVLGGNYSIKIIKQFLYSAEARVPLFYIILYFCAFEIIPALTLLKVLG